MIQNDYYIAFDENGTPYIEHGIFDNVKNTVKNAVASTTNAAKGVGRGVRQNHKYILKVFENGRNRYFYFPEEVKAYYEAKKQGVKNAAEYAQEKAKTTSSSIKDDLKEKAQKTAEVTKKVAREVSGQASRDRMDAAAEKYPELANKIIESRKTKVDKEIKYKTAERQLDRAAKTAMDAQQALNKKDSNKNKKANKEAQEMLAEAYSNYNKANKEHADAQTAYDKDNKALKKGYSDYVKNKFVYDHSIAGVYDKVAPKAKEMIDKAKQAIKAAGEKAKGNNSVEPTKDQKQSDNNAQEASNTKPHSRQKRIEEGSVTAEKGEKIDANGPVGDSNRPANTKKLENQETEQALKKGKVSSSTKDMVDKAKSAISERLKKPELTREEKEQPVSEGKVSSSTKDMVDKAKSQLANKKSSSEKTSYSEWSENDKDFDEKNYNKNNHVADTDFYTFKRNDGKWVVLEEDMKWVLPDGVTGNDPGIKSALKQFSDHTSSAKAIGNDNYTNSQWIDAVTDAIDEAAEKAKKNK